MTFSFEIRSQDSDTLARFDQLFQEACRGIAASRGVSFDFDAALTSAPAAMDAGWIARLEAAGAARGAPVERVPSGAGHDAAVFAGSGVPAAMVFVRNANGSHNPHEAMDTADLLDGVDLLLTALTGAAAKDVSGLAA